MIDWEGVVEKNRERLRWVLEALMTMAGLDPGRPSGAGDGAAEFWAARGQGAAQGAGAADEGRPTLPRRAHRAVLRLLRPAESAVRRLIVVAARDVVVEVGPGRPRPAGRRKSLFVRAGAGTGIVLPYGMSVAAFRGAAPRPHAQAFPLLDPLTRPGPPRPRPACDVPRIFFFGPGARPPAPLRPPCLPGDPIDAGRLFRRIAALRAALDDVPGQARRFARWRARAAADARATAEAARARQAAGAAAGPALRFVRQWPFRSGRPPGQILPGRRRLDIHWTLGDLNYFGREALAPDTS